MTTSAIALCNRTEARDTDHRWNAIVGNGGAESDS
jgi:hypothetical protein